MWDILIELLAAIFESSDQKGHVQRKRGLSSTPDKKREYGVNEKLYVPLEALNRHGNMVKVDSENSKMKRTRVYWKGKGRICGDWHPVTALSDPFQDTVTIKYLKKFRKIIESNIETFKKVEEANKLADRYSSASDISDHLLDEPAVRFYKGHLISIDGVGEKKAKKLFNFGFLTPRHIVDAPKDDLKRIPGVGDKTAEKIISGAQEMNEYIEYQ